MQGEINLNIILVMRRRQQELQDIGFVLDVGDIVIGGLDHFLIIGGGGLILVDLNNSILILYYSHFHQR